MIDFNNLLAISSFNLERLVAAIYKFNGYFVERNLRYNETYDDCGNDDIMEIDIVARYYSPNWEHTVLIECKGGGKYGDIWSFKGKVSYIQPHEAILVCSNPVNLSAMKKIAEDERMKIRVLSIEELVDENVKSENDKEIVNNLVQIYTYEDYLLDKKFLKVCLNVKDFDSEQRLAYNEIRKYYGLFIRQVWMVTDPVKQAILLKKYIDENKDFTRKIARLQGKNYTNSDMAIENNILCESASNIVVLNRLLYVVAAVRCSIYMKNNHCDISYLDSIKDIAFKNVVKELIDNVDLVPQLPNFIFYWIYYFGGIIDHSLSNKSELNLIGNFLKIDITDLKLYLDITLKIFTLLLGFNKRSFSWGVMNMYGKYVFKNIPVIFRSIGLINKENLGIDIYKCYPEAYQYLKHYNAFNIK